MKSTFKNSNHRTGKNYSTDFLETYFLGAKDLAQDAFLLFKEQIPDELILLEKFFTNKNLAEYAKLLHKWSPNFKIFGQDFVYEKLKTTENKLKENTSEILSSEEHKEIVQMIGTSIIEVEFILNQNNEN